MERLTSAAIEKYGLLRELETNRLALKNTFSQIQAVLPDAEMKQTKEKDLDEWLGTLKSASLEVENVIGKASTKANKSRIQRPHAA